MSDDKSNRPTVREDLEASWGMLKAKEEEKRKRERDIDEIVDLYRKTKEVGYILPVVRWLLRHLPKFPENK